MRIFFTSVARNYLPKVRVLAASLKAQHPEVHFCVALVDDPSGTVVASGDVIDEILGPDDFGKSDFAAWIFGHTLVEACTAVKPMVAELLLARDGVETVTYLDPDIEVFGRFDALFDAHQAHAIVLTPHQVRSEAERFWAVGNERSSLRYGTYNLGFFSVGDTDAARAFLSWWAERMREYCLDDIGGGLFTDQKWIDLAPALFDDVYILRDPGYNVATWNLASRRIGRDRQGLLTAEESSLIFVHFSGFDSGAHHQELVRHRTNNPVFVELSEAYEEKTLAIAAGEDDCAWSFGEFADGTPIPLSARRRWRLNPEMARRFDDPFASGPQTFQELVSGHGSTGVSPSAGLRQSGLARLLHDSSARQLGLAPGYELDALIREANRDLSPITGSDALTWPTVANQLRGYLDPRLPTVAHLTLLGGGTGKHVDDLIAGTAGDINGLRVAHTRCEGNAYIEIRAPRVVGSPVVMIPLEHAQGAVLAALQALGVSFVHIHHRFGLESVLRETVRAFAGAYVITLHDYAFIAPEPHLAGADGRWVGELRPGTWSVLQALGAERYHGIGAARMTSHNEWHEVLLGARAVIAPSRDCAERYRRSVPGLDPLIEPHWETGHRIDRSAPLRPRRSLGMDQVASDPVRVIIGGSFCLWKGQQVVVDVARLADHFQIEMEFFVFANRPEGEQVWPRNIRFLGPYDETNLGQLVALAAPTVAWFPSQALETYCYALSELLRLRRPVVASDLGALTERLTPIDGCRLVPHDADERSWLRHLISASAEADLAFDAAPVEGVPFYPQGYLELVHAANIVSLTAHCEPEDADIELANEPVPWRWFGAERAVVRLGGHSHRLAVLDAISAEGTESETEIAVLSVESPEHYVVPDRQYWDALSRADGDVTCILWYGNEHSEYFMVADPGLAIIGPRQCVIDSPTSIVPYAMVKYLWRNSMNGLRDVIEAFPHPERIVVFGTPPPKSESALRSGWAFEPLLGDLITSLGYTVESAPVGNQHMRVAAWDALQECLQETAEAAGAQFLAIPAGVQDPDGLLLPEYCAPDATHANATYGRLVVQALHALVRAHAV